MDLDDGSVVPEPAVPHGGRNAGLASLARIRPGVYGRTRNFLDGAVTRLSPFLRHGMITLAEARDAALAKRPRPDVDTFVRELAWREYYVRVHEVLGDRVWEDLEAYKTGRPASAYADALPGDIADATTGAACIDGFVRELIETGYMHNHARMWFASYVVHWRGVRWQAGAAFFLRHLLDGDPASNNLSWQWVASTFSHKPYIFNRGNLERYTRGAYCSVCPLAAAGCPFEAPYATLDARLFPGGTSAVDAPPDVDLRVGPDAPPRATPPPARAVVWLHEESLSVTDPARALVPNAPAIFVWDGEARRRDPWSAARDRFVREGIAEVEPARIASGDAESGIAAFAAENGVTDVVVTAPVDPRLREIVERLGRRLTVTVVAAPRLADVDRGIDLRRFSRYWNRAERSAFGTDPKLELGI